MSAAVVEEECDWTGPDAGMSTPREGSGSSGGGSSLSAAAGGASSVGAAAALAKGARPPQALLSSKAPLPSDLSSQILESSILNNPMWSARQREVGAARQLPSARRSGGEGAGALGAARLPAASMPALPLASGVLRGARGPAVSVFAPLSLRGYGGGGGGGGGSGSAGAAAAGAAGGSSAGAVVALGGSGGAGGGGGGGSGSGGVSDGESGDSSEDGGSRAPPPISFAPGSPLDLALQAKVPERRKRLHRPAVVKRLAIGADEFKRRAEAKALGKIIDKKHSQYHVSYGMMLGIYCSVVGSSSEATATLGRLQLDDLMAVRKLVFAPGGSSLTPPHPLPRAFKFKDYAPNVFHSLRERFSIDQTAYLQSLGGACEYIEFSSNSKSGSFFFYSHDGKFMIKTQSKRESKFLRRILAHYYQHIMTNPLTYLTRFYGMHRIKMPHLSKTIYFVVMQSVFYGDVAMTRMYDIKGSTIGRAATAKEKAAAMPVLKDLDMLSASPPCHIALGAERREAFLAQLKADAAFLERMQIMDYSLLLGIAKVQARGGAEGEAGEAAAGGLTPLTRSPSAGQQQQQQQQQVLLQQLQAQQQNLVISSSGGSSSSSSSSTGAGARGISLDTGTPMGGGGDGEGASASASASSGAAQEGSAAGALPGAPQQQQQQQPDAAAVPPSRRSLWSLPSSRPALPLSSAPPQPAAGAAPLPPALPAPSAAGVGLVAPALPAAAAANSTAGAISALISRVGLPPLHTPSSRQRPGGSSGGGGGGGRRRARVVVGVVRREDGEEVDVEEEEEGEEEEGEEEEEGGGGGAGGRGRAGRGGGGSSGGGGEEEGGGARGASSAGSAGSAEGFAVDHRRSSSHPNSSSSAAAQPLAEQPGPQALFAAPLDIARHPATGAALPPAPFHYPAAAGGVPGCTPEGAFNGELYFMGVIDILQQFTLRKRGENFFKSLVHPPAAISSVSPAFYASRFLAFVAANTR